MTDEEKNMILLSKKAKSIDFLLIYWKSEKGNIFGVERGVSYSDTKRGSYFDVSL